MGKHVILFCDSNIFAKEGNSKSQKLVSRSAAKLSGKGVKDFSYAFRVFKMVQGVSFLHYSPIKQILILRQKQWPYRAKRGSKVVMAKTGEATLYRCPSAVRQTQKGVEEMSELQLFSIVLLNRQHYPNPVHLSFISLTSVAKCSLLSFTCDFYSALTQTFSFQLLEKMLEAG